jgi:Epoxide hydrolase N terminus
MQELARYWATDYDWRRCEARLNALPNFLTQIDGLDIHLIHVRSRHEDALPLIVTHGWPGSIVEQLKIIEPLTDPTAHGGSEADAFHVLIPSLHRGVDRGQSRGHACSRLPRARSRRGRRPARRQLARAHRCRRARRTGLRLRYPAAAARRPRRPHQPWPGARLRDRPGSYRRRLRGRRAIKSSYAWGRSDARGPTTSCAASSSASAAATGLRHPRRRAPPSSAERLDGARPRAHRLSKRAHVQRGPKCSFETDPWGGASAEPASECSRKVTVRLG